MSNLDMKTLIDKLSPLARRSLEAAANRCIQRGDFEVGIDHLIVTLLEDNHSQAVLVLQECNIKGTALHAAIEDAEPGNNSQGNRPVFSRLLLDLMQEAWLLSSLELNQLEVTSGALMLCLVQDPMRYGQRHYLHLFDDASAADAIATFGTLVAGTDESPAPAATAKKDGNITTESALQKYCIDFTGKAKAGDIDPVFCRDREIRLIIDILTRRRKNNPIAVGDPGVGKTAVIEGLALKIALGDVPEVLADVAIFGLDLGLLQAGASVKGEFENRLKQVINDVQSSTQPIILFIDEAHTLIGAGGAAGGSDAANLLKPALARGELRTIAATTWSEYKKYFEKDPALDRRFQLVKLDEPTPEAATTILRGLRTSYENAHDVYISDDGIVAAAEMAARYITGRQLPDKAIDVIDTACARVKIAMNAKPAALDTLEREQARLQRELDARQRDIMTGISPDSGQLTALQTQIEELQQQHATMSEHLRAENTLVQHIVECRQQLDSANELAASNVTPIVRDSRDAEKSNDLPTIASEEKPTADALRAEITQLRQQLKAHQGDSPLVHYEVGPEEIASVIADWTGIPLGKMLYDESTALLQLGKRLKERVKGQDHALDEIHRGIQAAKVGLKNPDAPLAVFLLAGPSGVGKTETALAVADKLLGGERALITVNMSEFQEKHSVSRLIGSPPGYVGYGEGGLLTEAVRQQPYSVVLLDEVEKADIEVLNLFYQVFDKGVLSDGEGREINFRNTIIFLTTNLASETIRQYVGVTGAEAASNVPELVEAIRPELSAHFKPALLGRMQIAPYFSVSQEVLAIIVELKLQKLINRMADTHNIALNIGQDVTDVIAARCTENEAGARHVDLIINNNLLPKIAAQLLTEMQVGKDIAAINIHLDDEQQFALEFSEDAETTIAAVA